jgi:hypothetical protein
MRGGVPGKCCDQSLRILMKSEGMVMKARAFIQLAINADKKVVEMRKSRGQNSLGSYKSCSKAVVKGK